MWERTEAIYINHLEDSWLLESSKKTNKQKPVTNSFYIMGNEYNYFMLNNKEAHD